MEVCDFSYQILIIFSVTDVFHMIIFKSNCVFFFLMTTLCEHLVCVNLQYMRFFFSKNYH